MISRVDEERLWRRRLEDARSRVSLQGTSFEESRMITARVELLRSSLMSAWISRTTRLVPG
jgi:hypothetical protein